MSHSTPAEIEAANERTARQAADYGTHIGAALAVLDEIPALHRRGVSRRDECGTCSEPYPCGTVQLVIRIYRALTGEDVP